MWDVGDVIMLGIWGFGNMGYSGCEIFGTWEVRDVECSRCRTFGMWDVRYVGCLGCGMFRMWDVWDVECSRCGVFEMWNVGCGVFAGMWDVDLQNAWRTEGKTSICNSKSMVLQNLVDMQKYRIQGLPTLFFDNPQNTSKKLV